MEKYKIKVSFKNFEVGEVVDKNNLLTALSVPSTLSGEEILCSLVMADIIKIILPKSLEKQISVSQLVDDNSCDCGSCEKYEEVTFTSIYSLMDEHAMCYISSIDGLAPAFYEELIEMGYTEALFEESESDLYVELENKVRYFMGDEVFELKYKDNKVVSTKITLTDEYIENLVNEDEDEQLTMLFSSMDYLNEFISKELFRSFKSGEPIINLPVDEKRFSLNDIQKIINNIPSNNKSPFANEIADDIIESAIGQLI